MTNTEYRDPKDLHVHPALKDIPELPEFELKAIRAGMKEAGILSPLLIDDKNRLLDDHSRTIWTCAKAWAMKQVPVQVRAGDYAELILIHSMLHRRHLTKSAMALALAPKIEILHKEMVKNQRKALISSVSPRSGVEPKLAYQTAEDMAESFGMGRSLYFMALQLEKAFNADVDSTGQPKLHSYEISGGSKDGALLQMTRRQYYTDRIFRAPTGNEHSDDTRPMGLGAALAGIEGENRTKERDKGDPNLKRLFMKMLGGAESQLEFWSTSQDEALTELENRAARLKPEKCEALAEMHARIAKIYKDQSKLNQA